MLSTERAVDLIGRLAPDQAEVVLLRVVADLDVAATARVVGKSRGAVRVLTHRGLRRLATLLDQEPVPDRTPAAGVPRGAPRGCNAAGPLVGDRGVMRDHVVRPRDRQVAALLAAAAAPAERPVPGEAAALAAYRDAMSATPAPARRPMQSRTTVKLAAASAIGVLSLVGGGYAVAATGSLPGTAQQTAKDALANVGVTVPGPADGAAEETATRGAPPPPPRRAPTRGADASDQGDAVSDLATTTDLEGADKGAAVSGLASDGRSKAGSRPTPTTTATTAAAEADDEARAARPPARASGGASTAGAGNADTHRP